MQKLNLLVAVTSILFASSLVLAQTDAQTTESTPALQPATATVASDKLIAEFSEWSGSQENASTLVNGLRSGTDITLTSPGTDGAATTTTTFSPTTRPMGYGNIRIALSLAQEQLAGQGITSPTPADLQGALVGTPDSSTQGILQMRASGMGWGQIANSLGVKLGTVMSGKQIATPTTAAGQSTSARTNSSAQTRKGVVTASGNVTGKQPSGITTAASGSGRVTSGLGHAYGQGGVSAAGVVTAGGSKAGGHAGGHGNHGKGGGKP